MEKEFIFLAPQLCKINEHMEHGLMLKFKGSLFEDICLIAYNDHQLLDYNGIKIFLDPFSCYMSPVE